MSKKFAQIASVAAETTRCVWCLDVPLAAGRHLCTTCAPVLDHGERAHVGPCVRCGRACVRYGAAGAAFCEACQLD